MGDGLEQRGVEAGRPRRRLLQAPVQGRRWMASEDKNVEAGKKWRRLADGKKCKERPRKIPSVLAWTSLG